MYYLTLSYIKSINKIKGESYEGKREKTCILDFLKQISKKQYGVMIHEFLNRSETAPMLAVIEKVS